MEPQIKCGACVAVLKRHAIRAELDLIRMQGMDLIGT